MSSETNTRLTAQDVLSFWFQDGMQSKWFLTDHAFDDILKQKFGTLHQQARTGALDHWEQTLEGRLALVLILDQFSRNMFRGLPQAFASDKKALSLARSALDAGDDLWLKENRPDMWRSFLYLPFMHSENIKDQHRSVKLYLTHGPSSVIPYAQEHLDVVERFGRFPARNEALGRESTAEEKIFLSKGGGQFGVTEKKV